MKHKDFEINGSSRSNQRAKRRKTNLILNSLIAIVILLIIIVSFSIFFGNGENASTTADNKEIDATEKNEDSEELIDVENEKNDPGNTAVEENKGEDSSVESEMNESEIESEESSTEVETNPGSDSETVIVDGAIDPNVKKTLTNPEWQPIGTTQTGEHISNYDENSADWQEMIKAMSYGTGLEQNNMTVWFLGNNGDNLSVGTISSKDQTAIYRVYITWVDGQGWKPTKVEELIENKQR